MRWLRSPLARIVIGVAMVVGAAIGAAEGVAALGAPALVPEIAAVVAAVAAYVAFVRWLERRHVHEFAARRAPELVIGLAIGGALFATTMLVLAVAGVATFRAGDGAGIIAAAIAAATAAVTEELVFRAIVFRIVDAALGPWIAIAISAVLFGAAHLLGPDATVVAAIAIAIEAGVLLAAAFLVYRRLWLPIGIHAGWNFTQSGVFGHGHGLVDPTLAGGELWTGGSFGPESSVVAIAVCTLAGVALLVRARRRDR